ncbi:MAG: hypothetical protein WCF84_14700 [Anaerolineae bacterium]
MTDSIHSHEDTTQSFLIRLWQERPNEWRGTIRHVQSEAQRGFSQLDQALLFVREHTAGRPATPVQEQAATPRPWTEWLGRRRVPMAWAAMGFVTLISIWLIATNAVPGMPLSGTAGNGGPGGEMFLAFVAGIVLGGVGAGLWFRSRR